ncbi:MAG: Gfo/Idh/MocA family protein [Planctomycetia bacterium]
MRKTTAASRREFLEASLLAAATALAARSDATAADESKKKKAAKPAGGSAPAGDRLRVAVLGVKGRGNQHIEAYVKRNDAEIAVICDPDEQVGRQRVAEIEKATGKAPLWVADPREVMDDKSIDAVSIATPNHWHALASIWAMQAGKDVYVEKPVSHNVSEGRRIVEAARKYDRICQTGTQSRASKGLHDAMKFLRAGELGEIEIARGTCYKPRKSIGKVAKATAVPKHLDYDVWSGPAEIKPVQREKLHYDWHWVWDYGNGDLGNQGIHQMDIARWALGVDRLPEEVTTIGGRFGYVDDGETPNTELTFLKYGDKQLVFEVRGLPTETYRGAGVGVGVIVDCANGYLVVTSYTEATAFDKNGKLVKQFNGGGDHFGNFLDAVKSRKRESLFADIEEGHLSSAMCHLGNISYRLGEAGAWTAGVERLAGDDVALETLERTKAHLAKNGVDLDKTPVRIGARLAFDPKSETFVDDSRANAMLTREYRKPYVVPEAGKV